MGKSQQQKGYRGENNLRRLLQDAGIDCQRIPLSGASVITPSCDLLIGEDGDQAEVKFRTPDPQDFDLIPCYRPAAN